MSSARIRPPTPRASGWALAAGALLLALACGGGDGGPGDGGCPGCDGGPDAEAPTPDAGPGLADGEPCDADGDCDGGVCLVDEGVGACGRLCADADDCAAGETCGLRVHPSGADTLRAICADASADPDLGAPCLVDAECDAGLCLEGQCTVACDDETDCLAGQDCLPLTPPPDRVTDARVCTYAPIDAPTIASVPLFEGPVAAFDPQPLRSLGVPPDAVSVTFVAERLDDVPSVLVFSRVLGPGGSRMLRYAEILAYRDQPLRWIATPGVEMATVVVPNTTPDRVFFSGGRWQVEPVVLAQEGGVGDDVAISLRAEVKRAPGGVISAGTLDLRVWLVGVGVSAAEAPENPTIAEGLARARELLGAAGVELGEVGYRDAPAEVVERLSVVESLRGVDGELAELFRLGGEAPPGAGVDVFLVRTLENDEATMTLGIAGNIPGPPVAGTSTSGVAVAFDMIGSAEDLGKVVAHELGHYLGLFHVRERLDACAPGTGPTEDAPCAPFGGGDVLEDTTQEVVRPCPEPCDDARRFVMFWSLQQRADRSVDFSEGQGLVMRGHPLVR